jgi:hypothetical protein
MTVGRERSDLSRYRWLLNYSIKSCCFRIQTVEHKADPSPTSNVKGDCVVFMHTVTSTLKMECACFFKTLYMSPRVHDVTSQMTIILTQQGTVLQIVIELIKLRGSVLHKNMFSDTHIIVQTSTIFFEPQDQIFIDIDRQQMIPNVY